MHADARPPLEFAADRPWVSVVYVTRDSYEVCRQAIEHMAAQTLAEKIEIIIVGPSPEAIGADAEQLSAFHGWKTADLPAGADAGGAMVAGLRVATAPVFLYGEEHSYPTENLIAELVKAFRDGDWSAVGFGQGNANPETWVSWAHLYAGFAPTVAPVTDGEATRLGGHHIAYRMDVLNTFGDDLADLLDNECALIEVLRNRGHRVYRIGSAVGNHLNVARMGWFLQMEFHGQRGYAASRAESNGWPLGRRLFYAAATPLVPFVRVARAAAHVHRTGRSWMLPMLGPVMFAGMWAGAVGEAWGYLFSRGTSGLQKLDFELDRETYAELNGPDAPEQAEPAGRDERAPLPRPMQPAA